MQNILRKQDIGFTQVPNQVLNDPNLSFKATGLYAYMFGKPNGWKFSAVRIAGEKMDGKSSVWSGLQELEKFGYLQRKKLKTGETEYLLLCVSSKIKTAKIKEKTRAVDKPNTDFAKQAKSQTGKIGAYSNTVIDNNKLVDSNKLNGQNLKKVDNSATDKVDELKESQPNYYPTIAHQPEPQKEKANSLEQKTYISSGRWEALGEILKLKKYALCQSSNSLVEKTSPYLLQKNAIYGSKVSNQTPIGTLSLQENACNLKTS